MESESGPDEAAGGWAERRRSSVGGLTWRMLVLGVTCSAFAALVVGERLWRPQWPQQPVAEVALPSPSLPPGTADLIGMHGHFDHSLHCKDGHKVGHSDEHHFDESLQCKDKDHFEDKGDHELDESAKCKCDWAKDDDDDDDDKKWAMTKATRIGAAGSRDCVRCHPSLKHASRFV